MGIHINGEEFEDEISGKDAINQGMTPVRTIVTRWAADARNEAQAVETRTVFKDFLNREYISSE